jgi:two-component system, response regulator
VSGKSLQPVLLVEDSPDDVEFARRAFERCDMANELIVADEGQAALDLLLGVPGRPMLRPALVLLDLNIPAVSGREVLRRIKQRDDLRSLPVVVFTTSSHPGDVQACYRLGANSYHRKPSDFNEYILTIQAVTDYWLKRVIAPQPFTSLGLPIQTAIGQLQPVGADT